MWSLGVILYELCALNPPFNAESIPALVMKIANSRYEDLPNASYYSQELRDVIKMLLKNDPEERPLINDLVKVPIIAKEAQA